MQLNVGDTIPLTLQLDDGDGSLFPRAYVFEPDGTSFAVVDLAHVAQGYYDDVSLAFPSGVQFLAATFVVYEDVGHTVEAIAHGRNQSLFTTGISAGDTLPVALQLEDGDETMHPRATLYRPDGSVLATLDLAHVGQGYYNDLSQTLPASTEFVDVVFVVYEDAGHTVESQRYARSQTVFTPRARASTVVMSSTSAVSVASSGVASRFSGGVSIDYEVIEQVEISAMVIR